MLAEGGLRLVHVPGLAVNRARQGTVGGEHKSDPRDARVIADQVRTRADLRPIEAAGDADVELRLLVARRRDLVTDQTRRIGRLRDLLASIHPGLERVVEPTQKASLWLLSRYVTPAEIRRAGRSRLVAYLLRKVAFRTEGSNVTSTRPLAEESQVPGIQLIPGVSREVYGLIFLAIVVGFLYWFILEKTRFGFDLRATGRSETAAVASGVKVKRMVLTSMVLSGVVAGLVGMPLLFGQDYSYGVTFQPGLGFAGIAVAGVFVLRNKAADAPRPFKAVGYPITPAIFVLMSLIMVVNAIYREPVVSGTGLLVIGAGVPLYLWFRRSTAG